MKLVQQRRPAEYVRSQVSSARLAAMWAVIEAKERKAARHGPASRWWVAGALAASLAVVLFFFVVGRWHRPMTAAPMAGVVIDTGEAVQAVSLPEGSELELGPVTRLRIVMASEHEIRLRLERGRVSCDVTRVEGRRFVVEAGDTEVEVKGTRFEVNATPAAEGRLGVSVRVERGAVVVRDGTRAEIASLLPGEMWSSQPPPDAGAVESPPGYGAEPGLAGRSPIVDPGYGAEPGLAGRSPIVDPGYGAEPGSAGRSPIVDPGYGAEPGSAGRSPIVDPTAASASTAPPPVVRAPPLTAHTLFERADEARLAGRHAEAAADLERLLERFPHDPRAPVAAYGLGRLRLGPLHDAAGALAAFRVAIERDPGGVFREDAEVGRMQATEILGDVAQCKRLREAFVARYPASVQTARIQKLCNGS